MDELEYAVDTVRGIPFEKLAGEILREEGYSVHESGVLGTDGGWDTRIEIGGREGIGHASVANRWRPKLRDNAQKVEALEQRTGEDFDILVFVTNQAVSGEQELSLKEEINTNYGWELKILHRRDIIGITGHDRPDLAIRHFGFDPKRNDDHLNRIATLCEERLDLIASRDGPATDLRIGPAVVVHLIPNGVFSGNYADRSEDLPNVPEVGTLHRYVATKPTGKGKVNRREVAGGSTRYQTLLRKDGLYEAVDTRLFAEDGTSDRLDIF